VSWPRPRLWTIGFAAGAVVLVAFAVWCCITVLQVSRLRKELEVHVGWLRDVDEARAAVVESRAPGPARVAGDQLTRLADDLAAERASDDPLVPRLRDAARGLDDVAQARTQGAASEALERDVQGRIAEVAPIIRGETATISIALGDEWRAMYVIAGGAIALAFSILGLLGYLRIVVMPRVDSDADRLHRLAHRLAQFDRAAHGVAHELNSPLTAIVTNLQLLAERMKASPPVAATSNIHLVEDALQGLARVSGTVQDMRSPSGVGSGEGSTSFDPNAVVDAALSTTRFRVNDSVKVVLALERVGSAHAPDGLVQRLIEELLIGGFLAAKSESGEPITVKTSDAGMNRVAIELDLPQRALAAVDRREFERRMQALGGLFVVTMEGGRARVRFELPSGPDAVPVPVLGTPAPPAKPIDASPAVAADRVRILLVDDDELVRTSVTRVLAKHDVTTLSDGDAAIEQIVAGDYDLVLCDLMMPGKSGMDVYHSVVERRPELAKRFVFISGGASTPEAEEFLEAHATERLDKPFGMDSLRRLVADAARRRDAAKA
jgi:CheY-like chemotaxis protein